MISQRYLLSVIFRDRNVVEIEVSDATRENFTAAFQVGSASVLGLHDDRNGLSFYIPRASIMYVSIKALP